MFRCILGGFPGFIHSMGFNNQWCDFFTLSIVERDTVYALMIEYMICVGIPFAELY